LLLKKALESEIQKRVITLSYKQSSANEYGINRIAEVTTKVTRNEGL